MAYTQWAPGDTINDQYELIECTDITTSSGSLLWVVKCLSCNQHFLASPTYLRRGTTKCKCKMKYKKKEVNLYGEKSRKNL